MSLPSLFIPHGAGPCFFMRWTYGPSEMWQAMGAWLQGLAASLPERPKAILVVSAHWEAESFRLTASPTPELIYDYSGFPAHTYQLQYPVAGAPWLARAACERLCAAGLAATLDASRGLDHGAFIPFKLIYPQADIPMVQLSLRDDLDPAAHLAAGAALAGLREQGVLIVGSGMSFHNMRPSGADQAERGQAFDDWLFETLMSAPPMQRQRLCQWAAAPQARFAHPREEHLLPLLVASAAAGNLPARRVYTERLGGLIAVSAYRFG
ncbi:Aromatic ring-opening dioxygenase, catalytic subunit, LigB family [Pseudomonas sp. ok272]|uniref:DODA-type extradiol aromatic ring-opening family dioxygenase n=1 Tax=unclassified Pseudomonas TaxID=196821 RepID=UPI0008AB7B4F|nr:MULTISPECIES: class III extradiol ring-cleavage dioxygenase [unclassified Pseudomonas]SEN42740.1 Aromatic ring-opening dioxygenase, catalytic subunit, LigB family [Pseudomonas sp. ok272]SFN25644.1 Aromatic ring-opening dioxygenase, catalytic subunit, LigB family [Pseudomonas sp. ok602]